MPAKPFDWREAFERQVMMYRVRRTGQNMSEHARRVGISQSVVSRLSCLGRDMEKRALGQGEVHSTPLDVAMENLVTDRHEYIFNLGDDDA